MANLTRYKGRFVSDGTDKILKLRSDVDWIKVYNKTNISDKTDDKGLEFFYNKDMDNDDVTGIAYLSKTVTTPSGTQSGVAVRSLLSGDNGFKRLESDEYELGDSITVSATTNATQPSITATSHGLSSGDIVRLSGISEVPDICSVDFKISVTDANTFKFAYALANAPGDAGTSGYARKVVYSHPNSPRKRFIGNISKSGNTVTVTCTVDHGFEVGQKVMLIIPDEYKSIELNYYKLTIKTVPADNTFTFEYTSSITSFEFPTTTNLKTPAIVVGVGHDPTSVFNDGVDNNVGAFSDEGYIAIKLFSGKGNPAGESDDIIYWEAGTGLDYEE